MTPSQAQSVLASEMKQLRYVNGISAVRIEEAIRVLIPPAQAELCFSQADYAQARSRIFQALKKARENGCSSADLNVIAFRYGARIWEMRHDEEHPVEILKKREGKIWRYFLHERHW